MEADDKDEGDDTAPSEAFLSLQRELEEKEKIQQENAERAKNEDALAAEAANKLRRKVRFFLCPSVVCRSRANARKHTHGDDDFVRGSRVW